MSITYKTGISSFSLKPKGAKQDFQPERVENLELEMKNLSDVITEMERHIQELKQSNVALKREITLLGNEAQRLSKQVLQNSQKEEDTDFSDRLGSLEKDFSKIWETNRELGTRLEVLEAPKVQARGRKAKE